ncbi:MAG: PAS domain S-box protein, partial [Myxococcota bacterium]
MTLETDMGPSTRLVHTVLEGLVEGLTILDATGRHLYANDTFCEMTGFARDALIGTTPPFAYWAEGHRAEIHGALERMLREGDFGPFRLVFQRADGSTFPAEVRPARCRVDGELVYFATVRDVSEIEAGREREAELRSLLETMLEAGDLATWEWRPRTGELRASDAWTAMLGYAPGELRASLEALPTRIHPEDLRTARSRRDDLAAGEAKVGEAEVRVLDALDRWRWMLVRGYVTDRDAEGRATRVTGTVHDIHRRKVQEEQLRQLQKMEVLGQLTGGIAHDVNNVLSILRSNLDTLRGEPDIAVRQDCLNEMEDALARVGSLTNALLRYSRRERQSDEAIELGTFLRANRSVLKTALSPRAELSLQVPDAPCWVQASAQP